MKELTAKDFRIGNWVQNNLGTEYQVKAEHILMYHQQGGFFDKPIPLTEEWLIKFGATTLETPHGNQYSIGNRLFVIREGKIVDYGSSVILEFVHRFQNFMFELTNEELTLTQ